MTNLTAQGAPELPPLPHLLDFGHDAIRRAAMNFGEACFEAGRQARQAAPEAPREPMYLVMAGGDGFTSKIVPASKLDEAYLLTQWCDLESIDPEVRADTLEHFHNDDEWTHTDVTGNGRKLEFSLHLEDGWIKVIRLFGFEALAASEAEAVKVKADADGIANAIIRDMGELPDYSSPEDAPDVMMATTDELKLIILRHLATPTPQAADRKSLAEYQAGLSPEQHAAMDEVRPAVQVALKAAEPVPVEAVSEEMVIAAIRALGVHVDGYSMDKVRTALLAASPSQAGGA